MANRIKTPDKTIGLTLNVVLLQYLDELIRTGRYGNGHQSAIEKLVVDRIEDLIGAQELQKLRGPLLDDPKSET
jgi:hypothetical protein